MPWPSSGFRMRYGLRARLVLAAARAALAEYEKQMPQGATAGNIAATTDHQRKRRRRICVMVRSGNVASTRSDVPRARALGGVGRPRRDQRTQTCARRAWTIQPIPCGQVVPEQWTPARLKRALAKHLPARSEDKRDRLMPAGEE